MEHLKFYVHSKTPSQVWWSSLKSRDRDPDQKTANREHSSEDRKDICLSVSVAQSSSDTHQNLEGRYRCWQISQCATMHQGQRQRDWHTHWWPEFRMHACKKIIPKKETAYVTLCHYERARSIWKTLRDSKHHKQNYRLVDEISISHILFSRQLSRISKT